MKVTVRQVSEDMTWTKITLTNMEGEKVRVWDHKVEGWVSQLLETLESLSRGGESELGCVYGA
jgi:hypothetical protein